MAVRVEHPPPPTRPSPGGVWRLVLVILAIAAIAAWVTCAAVGFPA